MNFLFLRGEKKKVIGGRFADQPTPSPPSKARTNFKGFEDHGHVNKERRFLSRAVGLVSLRAFKGSKGYPSFCSALTTPSRPLEGKWESEKGWSAVPSVWWWKGGQKNNTMSSVRRQAIVFP